MSACVLDADVVIAVLDRSDAHHGVAAQAVKSMISDGTRLLLSMVNYAEALVRPASDPTTLRTAIDAINILRVQLLAPTAAIARQAAGFRSAGLSLPDGFALATALASDSSLATFDRSVRQAARAAGVLPAPAVP